MDKVIYRFYNLFAAGHGVYRAFPLDSCEKDSRFHNGIPPGQCRQNEISGLNWNTRTFTSTFRLLLPFAGDSQDHGEFQCTIHRDPVRRGGSGG